jgi:hypothetical protein
MRFDEAKKLLSDGGMTFGEKEFATQREYWEHCSSFWHSEYASPSPDSKRKVLAIACRNGAKDIELEFSLKNGEFEFEDLLFGSFAFEITESLPEEDEAKEILLEHLEELTENRLTVLTLNAVGQGVLMNASRLDLSPAARNRLIEAFKAANSPEGKMRERQYVAEIYDRDSFLSIPFSDPEMAMEAAELFLD